MYIWFRYCTTFWEGWWLFNSSIKSRARYREIFLNGHHFKKIKWARNTRFLHISIVMKCKNNKLSSKAKWNAFKTNNFYLSLCNSIWSIKSSRLTLNPLNKKGSLGWMKIKISIECVEKGCVRIGKKISTLLFPRIKIKRKPCKERNP